jgi:hypothetical protein
MNIASDLPASILRTAHQIANLKRQIESADDVTARWLQHQFKELQILEFWQLSQPDKYKTSEVTPMAYS